MARDITIRLRRDPRKVREDEWRQIHLTHHAKYRANKASKRHIRFAGAAEAMRTYVKSTIKGIRRHRRLGDKVGEVKGLEKLARQREQYKRFWSKALEAERDRKHNLREMGAVLKRKPRSGINTEPITIKPFSMSAPVNQSAVERGVRRGVNGIARSLGGR